MREALTLNSPGLFITGTDTGVGKTVATCAIAAALHRQRPGLRLGACKPFASGCRRTPEGALVNEDVEALASFVGRPLESSLINPVAFEAPLAPAVAAEQERRAVDWSAVRRSLEELDRQSDAVLIEGVGGLMVPLDPAEPRWMVAELARWIGYPVLVVCRPTLGTLNHTLMTVKLLRQAGCRVAGLLMNGQSVDEEQDDPSSQSNRQWLERLTGLSVLATLPRGGQVQPQWGILDKALVDTAAAVDWMGVLDAAQPAMPGRVEAAAGAVVDQV